MLYRVLPTLSHARTYYTMPVRLEHASVPFLPFGSVLFAVLLFALWSMLYRVLPTLSHARINYTLTMPYGFENTRCFVSVSVCVFAFGWMSVLGTVMS